MIHEDEDKLEEMAQRARERSVGSIDPGVNAQAIALSSDIVRERLEPLLGRGGRVLAVKPIAGSGFSPNEFALSIEVELPDSDQGDTQFIAWVDIPGRIVQRVTTGLPVGVQPTAPFSIMVPSAAPTIQTPVEDVRLRRIREFEFIEKLKIDDLLELLRKKGFNLPSQDGYGDTKYSTRVSTPIESGTTTTFGTASESGGTADDSKPDSQYDSMPETTADYEDDYRVDTI
jgi:hypothetical protein